MRTFLKQTPKMALIFLVLCTMDLRVLAQTKAAYDDTAKRSVKLLEDLIASKPITGDEKNASPVIEKRLSELGLKFEKIMTGEKKDRPNYLIRLKAQPASDKKALMIMSHIDVVPASGQAWTKDAHKMSDDGTYYYGRGTVDMLGYLSVALELVGEIKNKNVALERDLVFLMNSDEEKGGRSGVSELIAKRPDIFENIEYILNEGGAVITDSSEVPLFIGYSGAEKIYQDYKLEAKGPTGHSSVPPMDNAIYGLSEAILKIKRFRSTPRLIPLVQEQFKQRALVETDPELKSILSLIGSAKPNEAQDLSKGGKFKKAILALETKYPTVNSIIRNTCVATVANGGFETAKNALPPTAVGFVNCRLLPDEDLEKFSAEFKKNFETLGKEPADVTVTISAEPMFQHSLASPLNNPVIDALKQLSAKYFKTPLPVIPTLLTGGTDTRYTRKLGIPSYGIGPNLISDADRKRSHGIDERINIANLPYGIGFFHNLILMLAATPDARKPASEFVYPILPSRKFGDAFGSELSEHPHSSGCQH